MDTLISDPITLTTRAGEFTASHLAVRSPQGGTIREGVVLRSRREVLAGEAVLVRVQSSCLFSESFWATDCDCALQLQTSLVMIAAAGGAVFYFYEEGRGVGLAKKFQAIRLQQLYSYDTAQAYECLKLVPDGRSYAFAAAAIIAVLGQGRSVTLLSNNREKEDGLKQEGVVVVARRQLVCGWGDPAVRRYLLDKRDVLGHDIPDANQDNSAR